MNPRTEAIAFRIWQYAAPKGWDVTLRDIADAVGVGLMTVRNILRYKGWAGRVRVMTADFSSTGWSRPSNLVIGFDAITADDFMIGNTSLTP